MGLTQEQLSKYIVYGIVISIFALVFLNWAFTPSSSNSIPDDVCTPDYMGGCN